MSLNPINFYTATSLSPEELRLHGIDERLATSSLPCYSDSIFSVTYTPEYRIHRDAETALRPGSYLVTRVEKSEINFPLNTVVVKSYMVVAAMLIDGTGRSHRRELANYRFELQPSSDYKSYHIVKRLAAHPRD